MLNLSDTEFSEVIQEVTPTMALIIDKETQRIVFYNQRFQDVSGYSGERLINTNIYSYINNKDYIEFAYALEYFSKEENSTKEHEISIVHENGDLVDVIFCPRFQKSYPNYVFLFFTDNRIQAKKNQTLNVYQQIFSTSKEMMSLIGTDLKYRMVNKAYLNHYGVTEEEILNTPVKDMHGDNADFIIENIKHTMTTGEAVRIQPQIKDVLSDSGYQYADVLYSAFYDDNDKIIGVIVAARNITSLKKQESEIRKKMNYYESLFQHSPDLLASVNLKTGEIIESNQTFETILGYEKNEIIGKHIFDFHVQSDNSYVANAIAKLKYGSKINGLEVSLMTKGKEKVDSHLRTTPLIDMNYDVAVFVWRDIRNQKRLAYRASHDPLTNLLNRSGFMEIINNNSMDEVNRKVLCYLDIDNFKQLNDQQGHLKGDDFLIDLARIMTNVLTEKDLICRIGGDEFMILVSSSEPLDVKKTMANILDQIEERIRNTKAYMNLGLGLSVGIAEFYHNEAINKAIKRADTACYNSKNSGKNTISIFDSANDDKSLLTTV